MKRNSSIVVLIICYWLGASAQNPDKKRQYHWYFGARAGMDFSNGSPVADTSGAMDVWKGSTTMSDTAGNLLFYTDGKLVWNAAHDTMPNGDIFGIPAQEWPMESVVAVPKPGVDNIYYIFTSDGVRLNQQNGLQYHIVDMSLDNGLGDVTEKNSPLWLPATEQVCAVRHANTCDYWLISHKKENADYLAYLVTADGVDLEPVVSTSGRDYSIFTGLGFNYSGGISLRASPQGDKLVTVIHWVWQNTGHGDELQFSRFDNSTGVVSNSFLVPLDSTFSGRSFSASGQVFYAEHGSNSLDLDQFDLSVFDSVSVNTSRFNMFTTTTIQIIGNGLQLAPDGKLYSCNEWDWLNGIDSLNMILYPEVLGPGCMPVQHGFGLNGRLPAQVMPSQIADFLAPSAPEHCSVGQLMIPSEDEVRFVMQGGQLSISSLPAGHYRMSIWNAAGQLYYSGALVHDGGDMEGVWIGLLPVGYCIIQLAAPQGAVVRSSFVNFD